MSDRTERGKDFILQSYKESAAEFEPRWRSYWAEKRIFVAPNPSDAGFDASKPKCVVLDFFPYPSGIGLHIGHPLGYIATDVVARFHRMRGFNVLHAMGFDAFGLPAEQYALQTGRHPRLTTEANIANITEQLRILGFDHDPERRFSTHEPEYYRWTQWIFLQIFGSFYDPTERWTGPDGRENLGRALPIAKLADKLRAGEWVIDRSGTPVPASAASPDAGPFQPFREEDLPELEDRARLAFREEVAVNWCPQLGTVLSDEEVTRDGRSERGDFPVYRRPLRQWMLRIRAYADRLLSDLDDIDWPDGIKEMQRNWIGRSDGMLIQFPVDANGREVSATVFTTRPDTIFGATFLVLAPAHPLVAEVTTAEKSAAVESYRRRAAERRDEPDKEPEISGEFTGSYALNPATGETIPVWIADYILMGYGTGAIMAVPGHDERDWRFAKHFGLPVRAVVMPGDEWLQANVEDGSPDSLPEALRRRYLESNGRAFREAFVGNGTGIQSGNLEISLDGMKTPEAKEAISRWLETRRHGRRHTDYRLRNWLFSRQRYWGEPFPVVFDVENGRCHAVSQTNLPVLLPELNDFTPRASDDPMAPPESPLGRARDWVEVSGVVLDDGSVTILDRASGARGEREIAGRRYPVRRFRREVNTMPNWAGSCWYYLRYCDPHNDKEFVSRRAERYWMFGDGRNREGKAGGVDLYMGGAEHAVLHLLYARFWHKVLYDLGHVSTSEPFQKLFNQGMITADAFKDGRGFYVDIHDVAFRKIDGRDAPVDRNTGETLTTDPGKMGKRYKNGIPPEEICARFTVDVFRLYEMYMGPLDATKPWNADAIIGMQRFLSAVWRIAHGNLTEEPARADIHRLVHKTIRKVTQDIERLAMNTALAALIELTNALSRETAVARDHVRGLILMLAPFAPHLAEELFSGLFAEAHRRHQSVARAAWPAYDETLTVDSEIEIPVTVNGKKRAVVTALTDATDDEIRAAALADPAVRRTLGDKIPERVIIARSRRVLINIVVRT